VLSLVVSRKLAGYMVAVLLPTLVVVGVTPPPTNLPQALSEQERLTAERPQDARVWNDLGNLLALASRFEEAEAAYRKSLELEPARASARFNLGLLYQQRGDAKAALKEYRQLLEDHPGHAWGHYLTGAIYEQAGQPKKAVERYAQAFRLDPHLAFAEVNPYVIDSRLSTEALLAANTQRPATSLAPKTYEEPARITQILVPPPPKEAPAADDLAGEEPVEDEDLARARPRDRVLNARDLDPDAPANQVNPSGSQGFGASGFGFGGARRSPGGSGVTPRHLPRNPVTQGRVPGQLRPQLLPQAVIEEGGDPTAAPTGGGRPLTTPRGRIQFQPGTASTGRTGTELVPAGDQR
jgi:hypothetical protein